MIYLLIIIGAILIAVFSLGICAGAKDPKELDDSYGPFIEGSWKWDDTKCKGCQWFEGCDMCLHKEHWGSIGAESLNKCYHRGHFKAKEGQGKC